jgi:hypothetical protein
MSPISGDHELGQDRERYLYIGSISKPLLTYPIAHIVFGLSLLAFEATEVQVPMDER